VIALLDAAAFARLMTGAHVRIAADGALTLAGEAAGEGGTPR